MEGQRISLYIILQGMYEDIICTAYRGGFGGREPRAPPPLKGPLTDPKPNIINFLAYSLFEQLTIFPWVMIFYQNQNQNFYFLLIPVFKVGDQRPQGGRTNKKCRCAKSSPVWLNLQYAPDCVPCMVLFLNFVFLLLSNFCFANECRGWGWGIITVPHFP